MECWILPDQAYIYLVPVETCGTWYISAPGVLLLYSRQIDRFVLVPALKVPQVSLQPSTTYTYCTVPSVNMVSNSIAETCTMYKVPNQYLGDFLRLSTVKYRYSTRPGATGHVPSTVHITHTPLRIRYVNRVDS